jgi:hypothetical protein
MISLRTLKAASSAFVFSLALAHAQNGPTVQQKSEKSTCSNIVALTGNVNLNCSSLTPEQKKILERIQVLLKKILANQSDSKALLDKIDKMEEMNLSCEGGNCAQSKDQTGGITAGQIVNQEPITWYDWDGNIHRRQGSSFYSDGMGLDEFSQMVTFENSRDWKGLKDSAIESVKFCRSV